VRRTLIVVACALCLLPTRALASAPSNDDFDGTALSGTRGSISGTNTGATAEDGEFRPCNIGTRTVWYHWTAPSKPGVVVVDTLNRETSLDTVLALYAGGPGIEALEYRWCSDDAGTSVTGSRVVLRPEPRSTYYFQVGGFGAGTFRLDYRFHACTIVGTDEVETLVGTSGDDVICGERLIYRDGGDTVVGLGGDDFLAGYVAEGGPGDDFLVAGIASYRHAASPVNVDLRDYSGRGEGRDTIYVGDIVGSPFDDRLNGDGYKNTIFGRNGDDILVGRGAAGPFAGDALYGGKGNDTCDGDPC
jgi:hypothetical protein